jgi:hypothetical protein
MLKCFNAAKVEYLVIGSYAVAVHGFPRGTVDMDLWVAINPDNADRVMAALELFGFGGLVERSWLLKNDNVIRMGVPPYRIEISTGISGVDFASCYARRFQAVIDGVETHVISLEDLKINKRAAGRPKDLADLDQLP